VKPDTIAHGIDYLALATGTEITDERMQVYVNQLADLKDDSLYADTIKSLTNDTVFMPTVAEIRARYREHLMRRAMTQPRLASGNHGLDDAPGNLRDHCIGCDTPTLIRDLRAGNGWCPTCTSRPDQEPAEDRLRRWLTPMPNLRTIDPADNTTA